MGAERASEAHLEKEEDLNESERESNSCPFERETDCFKELLCQLRSRKEARILCSPRKYHRTK